jgi:chloramphenicol-sensitive protein RarD
VSLRTFGEGEADPRVAGLAYAVGAYLWWGLGPLYFKAVGQVPALEVLAHRVVWSVLLLAGLVAFTRHWGAIVAAIKAPRTLIMLLLSTIFITLNWGIFIWAVVADRVLEVSLGYYINPLVSVVLGVLVLKERLTRWQSLAVVLAAAGVLNLALQAAAFPWVSLVLAFSFGLYGLIRKTTPLGSVDGLFLETMLMLPLALGYLLFLGWRGEGHFLASAPTLDILLFLAGLVTMVPLVWFASAARRLNYSTVGLLQYIAPTSHFLLAVFLFGEVFTPAHALTFACIWTAVAIFTVDTIGRRRQTRRLVTRPLK